MYNLDVLREIVRKAENSSAGIRYSNLGAWLWISGTILYFIVQAVVMFAWPVPFSFQQNYISDLGSTTCGLLHGRYICSPWHSLMNNYFIISGITLLFGAILIYYSHKLGRVSRLMFSLVGIAGIGTIVIGMVPEDILPAAHSSTAVVCLTCFNIGVITTYWLRVLPRWLRVYSLISGMLGLFALGMLIEGINTPIGNGGVERISDYVPDIWVIVMGIYSLRRLTEDSPPSQLMVPDRPD